MLLVYGIKQCDTCRNALKWLMAAGVEHQFHDIRSQGLEPALLKEWLTSEFSDELVNRRSTTWRGLSEHEKSLQGPELTKLILANPTLIKRPVFVDGRVLAVGFAPKNMASLLGVSGT